MDGHQDYKEIPMSFWFRHSELNVLVAMFAFGSGVAFAAPTVASDVRIGPVDMQKALQSVEEGKKARGKLETAFNSKKRIYMHLMIQLLI